jgi:hypothetical protein
MTSRVAFGCQTQLASSGCMVRRHNPERKAAFIGEFNSALCTPYLIDEGDESITVLVSKLFILVTESKTMNI